MGVWVCVCVSTLSLYVFCCSVGLDAHVSAAACLFVFSNANKEKTLVSLSHV